MIVCIAEKPSVAKDIAKVLKANELHDGYYEGSGYQVTWTFGHLCELKSPHDYNTAWKSWKFSTLPIIPPRFGIKLKSQPSIKHQFDIICELFNNAEEVVNCGDAGIEGELIQRWVYQLSGATCPVKRLWINSLTESAIKEGFKNLKDQSEYQSLYEAGLARSISDWLLGMNATRYYTLIEKNKGTLSVGRVQTPTLALVVNRQQEIDEFVPEAYWTLSTTYKGVVFNSEKSKYTDHDEVINITKSIKDKPFTITNIETKKSTESAPHLFDLTSLQVECNKKLGFSADETLSIIQSLYEQKLTTYPRVDTTYLPNDVYDECPRILSGLLGYTKYTSKILDEPLRKSKKVFDDSKVTDHYAIIPTGNTPYQLDSKAVAVFDMIVKRFIAVFYPDCISSNTIVTGEVEGNVFRATGRQILDYGWYDVYGKTPEGKLLPNFEKGENGKHKPKTTSRKTTPPVPYTEATLLRAMETCGKSIDDDSIREALKENGIGRPSTRAQIIETLFKRGYMVREGKNLIPTYTGKRLIKCIQNPILKSAELTGQWERKLRDIELNKYSAAEFIKEIKIMVNNLIRGII